jgi:hypothetical protein
MLTCMNCKKPVEQGTEKFFGQVFICVDCNEMATHFFRRMENELKQLLTMAHENIRVALISGKFNLPERDSKELSKKEVLEEVLRMESAREAHAKSRAWPTTTSETQTPKDQMNSSGESTPPHVQTLAALGRSSSTKPNPQD